MTKDFSLFDLLLIKLKEGFIVRFCMNSMRVKMCRIYKPNTSSCESYLLPGNGDGATSMDALKSALESFKCGYVSFSGYSSGDTADYNLIDKLVHTGYNVYMWIDSGLFIMQIYNDELLLIPSQVLLQVQPQKSYSWEYRGNICVTKEDRVDLMHNVNCPPLNTYSTTRQKPGFSSAEKYHHLFRKFEHGKFISQFSPFLIS